ncbi:MAG: HipA N-terminal domain-containing protein [Bacilli bacterium]|jgi:serine/threonine-protein kinase HipA|nr:HipA N-terminal domain-containing protein [Bacilli bacterium]
MKGECAVCLWGTKIGKLAYSLDDDVALFQYDQAFMGSGVEVCPLLMPLSRKTYSFPTLSRESFHGLPPLVSDSLPDHYGEEPFALWLKVHNVKRNEVNPVEALCYIGQRGMGALEYRPSYAKGLSKSERIEIDSLPEVARKS